MVLFYLAFVVSSSVNQFRMLESNAKSYVLDEIGTLSAMLIFVSLGVVL